MEEATSHDDGSVETSSRIVFDCLPLIAEATKCKEKGNMCVKQKQYNDAVKAYEQGLEMLLPGEGQTVLQDEQEQIDVVKAALYANIAQCMINLQLYRRAVEACTECLKYDSKNAKALHRRSLAFESLREWEDSLADALALRKLGGGSLDAVALEKRCETLLEKNMKENKTVNKVYDENAELFQMKERFEEVMEKYDLGDGFAAPEVVNWLVTDNNFQQTVQRVSKRWDMSTKEAEHFARWLSKGLEMKIIPDPREIGASKTNDSMK